jgi:hypothetical protein
MAEENRIEGARIELFRRGYYPGTRRIADCSIVQIMDVIESPRETFEFLFPRYQIGSYRGIPLYKFRESGILLEGQPDYSHFAHHRFSGLSINSCVNASKGIENMGRVQVEKALRHKNKRDPEFLGGEALAILQESLLKMEGSYRSSGMFENFSQVIVELASAFENLKKAGKIKAQS